MSLRSGFIISTRRSRATKHFLSASPWVERERGGLNGRIARRGITNGRGETLVSPLPPDAQSRVRGQGAAHASFCRSGRLPSVGAQAGSSLLPRALSAPGASKRTHVTLSQRVTPRTAGGH